jgi:hypothetical protein
MEYSWHSWGIHDHSTESSNTLEIFFKCSWDTLESKLNSLQMLLKRLGILIILERHTIIFNNHAIHYISIELMRQSSESWAFLTILNSYDQSWDFLAIPGCHEHSWSFNTVFKCSWDILQMLLRYSWEQTKHSSNALYNHNSLEQSWHIHDSLKMLLINPY